ncbi:MAG: hypothetical protein ACNA74_05615 [Desulfurivibrio sp.]
MIGYHPAATANLRHGLLLVGALLILLLPAAPGQAFAPYPSHYRWRTLTTENFAIHFPYHLEEQAERTARIAEQVHTGLSARFTWTPRGRTQVIIADHRDYANAAATSFPYNTVHLLLRPAPPGEELANYEEWLALLFTHEYVHILHLDQARGANGVVRSIFGRIITPWTFPNWFSPQWQVEGLATCEETRITGRGRTDSPYFQMIVRMAALEGKFPSLARMQGFQASWPGGYNRYVFGSAFLQYIAATRGEEGLYRQAADYAGQALPFRLNTSFRKTVGARPDELWREWKQAVEQEAAAVKERVEEQGITGGRLLTDRGFRMGGPRFSPDGRFLAYTEAGARQWPSLRLLEPATGRDQRLTDAMGATGLSFSPDGRYLAFSRWERHRAYELYSDLYLYDLEQGKVRRLTRGARLRDGDFHPHEGLLVAVREGRGVTTLVLVDRESGETRPLREDDEPVVYGRPRWSPDGSRLAVAAWRRGRTGLEIITADGRESRRLLESADSTPAWPVWSEDGQSIYFTWAATGVHNIHRLDPATGELGRVTNVVGGAFEPALSAVTGQLAFVDYSARGFDLRLLEEHRVFDPGDHRGHEASDHGAPQLAASGTAMRTPVSEPDRSAQDVAPRDRLPAPLSHRRYLAGSTLLPRGWMPVMAGDEEEQNYGFSLWAADALQRHQLEAAVLYGTASERWSWAATYRNHWFYPLFEINAADFAVNHGNLWTPPEDEPGHRPLPDYWERRRSLRATLIVPLLRLRWGVTGRIGVLEQRLESLGAIPATEEPPAKGALRGTTLGLTFDNREWPALAISPERGWLAQTSWNHFSDSLGGDYNLDEFLFEWRTFAAIPFLRHHVLGWWVKGGAAEGDHLLQKRFQLGGVWGSEELLGESEGVFPLRGYPQAVQRGDRILRSTLEYRLPLIYHERGPAVFPLFLDRSHLALFAEAGAAWDGSWRDDANQQEIKSSVGVEYKLDLVLGHLLPLTLRVGMAYRLDNALPREDRPFLYLGFVGHQF